MKQIDLRNQSLREVPNSIFDQPEEVEVLDLSGNQLSELPDEIETLSNLKIGFFSNNQFTTYPEVLSRCPNLSMVSFKDNAIETVSEGCLSPTIRWLILTNNQISVLPNDFGKLEQLEKLALAGNQLKQLPDSISNCRSLALARISANQLEAFPDQLLQLDRLAWLAFDSNPFVQSHQPDSNLQQYDLTDFILGEVIGEGASGTIRKATRKSDDTPVAIKLFKGEITSDGSPINEMYNCIAAGNHRNLVKLLGQIVDPAALIFEYISNDYFTLGNPPSLETCSRDTFPEDFSPSIEFIKQVVQTSGQALQHLHEQQILHGDFYAHNIMANSAGETYLGDYGAASSLKGLTEKQVAGLSKMDVLAFGYLIDDLLVNAVEISTELQELREMCLSPQTNRPSQLLLLRK